MDREPSAIADRALPRRAAVVGAGTMGSGIAQVLALGGVACALGAVSGEEAARRLRELLDLGRRYEQRGLFAAGSAEAIEGLVSAAPTIGDAAEGAELVIEAVAEDPEIKRRVFATVEAAAPESAIVASNTSAIPIRELAATLRRPERFLGMHWFNPAQFVPCVELIAAPETERACMERSGELLTALGKRPVEVGDAAGFVANRIQFAMFKEAASVVADGVATAEQVDEVVSGSFGFRLPFFGPFAIADMAGLDVYEGAYRALEADLGARFSAPESVLELTRAGRLGAKVGHGYREWPRERLAAELARRDAAYAALGRLLHQLDSEEG